MSIFGPSCGTQNTFHTLAEVSRWTQTLAQHGYQLAPASALLMHR